MLKRIYKCFFVWQFEKEEKWLNEMAARGLALRNVGFCKYDFETCAPGEYMVRFELLDELPSHPQSESYIKFLESTGAEQIGSYMRWLYMRRKTADGEFDLFSDLDSRIAHVNRIFNMLRIIFIAEIPILFSNVGIAIAHGLSAQYIIAGVLFAIVAFLGYGTYRIWKIRERLKADRQIHE